MMNQRLVLLSVTAIINLSIADPLVQLPNGQIQGREAITFANTSYFAFEKIPYAAPPIGSLRFKAPQPAQNWEGVLSTTHLDVSCYQLQGDAATDSEDCLFLNVFTPQLPTDGENVSLPVMFFIHGGSFMLGSGMNAPPDLYVDNGVVLVAVNYRLGPFGFISTGDDVIPGNNGLKDQLLAIQWTHDNIKLFGGDPEKVTIFGQSSGSASCAYQLLNQNSDGLFRGIILESGTFLNPWAIQRNPRGAAFGTASILNDTFVTNQDSQALLEFLQSVDAAELDAAAEQQLVSDSQPWVYDTAQGSVWAPVIEVKNPDAFITKKMYGLLQAGNIIRVPTLLGFNSEESLLFNQDPDVFQSIAEQFDASLDLIVNDDMNILFKDNRTKVGLSIRDIYTGGEPFADHLGDGIRYSSDNAFTRAIIKYAQLYSQLAETYLYQFSYDGQLGEFFVNVHYDGAESVGHSEEAFYLFCSGLGCDLSTFQEYDQITQQRLIKLWTDFAKYLNPTPEPSELLQNITWPRVSTEGGDLFYLNINETIEVKNHPKENTYQKWIDLYNSLDYSDFDTY